MWLFFTSPGPLLIEHHDTKCKTATNWILSTSVDKQSNCRCDRTLRFPWKAIMWFCPSFSHWISILSRPATAPCLYDLKQPEQLICLLGSGFGEMMSGTTDFRMSLSVAIMCLTRKFAASLMLILSWRRKMNCTLVLLYNLIFPILFQLCYTWLLLLFPHWQTEPVDGHVGQPIYLLNTSLEATFQTLLGRMLWNLMSTSMLPGGWTLSFPIAPL